ncbi:phospholipase A and acyltransferase 4 [Lepeophtheirus salmonis]|uniref:phospholipase A and acyltransferase 4 n=1 Tax=Lepeophtheirus salmonis TaxID=72036 RepID=UPI001AE6FD9B|nr:phospholipase A and acyltransferase 1-like [Lepeophtheirus salmonis]
MTHSFLNDDKWFIREGIEKINMGKIGKYLTLHDWEEFLQSVQIGDCIEIPRKTINHWCIFVGPHFYYKKYGRNDSKKWHDKSIQQIVHINGDSPLSSTSYSLTPNGKTNVAKLDFFVDVVKDSKFRINNYFDLVKESRSIENILITINNELNEPLNRYHLLLFNCEHFVKYVRNDNKNCDQIDQHRRGAKYIFSLLKKKTAINSASIFGLFKRKRT